MKLCPLIFICAWRVTRCHYCFSWFFGFLTFSISKVQQNILHVSSPFEGIYSSSVLSCVQGNVKNARTSTQCLRSFRVLVMEQCLDSDYLGRSCQANINDCSVTCKISWIHLVTWASTVSWSAQSNHSHLL